MKYYRFCINISGTEYTPSAFCFPSESHAEEKFTPLSGKISQKIRQLKLLITVITSLQFFFFCDILFIISWMLNCKIKLDFKG